MKLRYIMVELLVLPITVYKRVLSPLLPASCRFYPSCSIYAIEALRKHGIPKGAWLAIRRLVRCNPFCSCGYDPVP